MLKWIARGMLIGAVVGSIFLAIAGGLLGALMGTIASLPSMGNPELVRKETVRVMSHGALYGIFLGSVVGSMLGLFGNIRAFIIGALVGAISLGLGGAAFGGITVNNNPVQWSRLILFSLVGAGFGLIGGLAIGLIITPLDKYLLKRVRGEG